MERGAYAAMRRNVPAKIFVRRWLVRENSADIRVWRDLVVSESVTPMRLRRARLGRPIRSDAIHAFDQEERCSVRERWPRTGGAGSDITTLLVAVGRRPDCRNRRVVSGTHQGGGRRTGLAPRSPGARGRPAGECRSRRIAADSLAPRRVGELVFPIFSAT